MRFRDFPRSARLYIVGVIAAGAMVAGWSAFGGAFNRPWRFLALLAAAVIFNTVKIELTAIKSTFSIGYAVSFAAILILGRPGAVWIAIAGAWAQCSFNVKVRSPWYQTGFNISVLALATQAAGLVLSWTHGEDVRARADFVIPSIMLASIAYFVANSLMMATVIALTTNQRPVQVWDRDFLWGAPNYFIGAFVATVAVQSASQYGVPSVIVLASLLFLTFRLYIGYVRRLDESLTDPLTRLPNRRSLASHAENEIARASRSGQPFAVVMGDVDRFKQINDTYGHQKGDEVLGLIADGFRRQLRPYDFCARYAGDEFVLILPGCTAEMAVQRAETIAATIAESPLTFSSGESSPLSVSLGVAAFPNDGKSYEDLLAVADARMYRRKARDRAPHAPDVPEVPADRLS
jgi:diguanylate cyclase (GGDEF)-like protein